jgi:hypothetical protein
MYRTIRRQLSMAAAKAYSACLLHSITRVGEKNKQVAKRRSWQNREVKKMEEEWKTYCYAFVGGITARRGHFVH